MFLTGSMFSPYRRREF